MPIPTIQYYFEAFRFIRRHHLTYYYWAPILLAMLLLWGGLKVSEWLTQQTLEGLQISNWFAEQPGWLYGILEGLVWFSFRILLFILLSAIGGFVLMMTMSPVYIRLSDKVHEILTGNPIPFSLWNLFIRTIAEIGMALRNMWVEGFWTFLLFVAGFIPLLGLATPILMLLITSRIFGSTFLHYAVNAKHRSQWNTLWLGMPFTLALSVPFVGIFLAAYFSIPTIVAAQLITFQEDTKKTL